MSNIIDFTKKKDAPLTVKEVLKRARKRKFDLVIVIGWHEEDDSITLTATGGSNADVLWALEHGKTILLEGDEE